MQISFYSGICTVFVKNVVYYSYIVGPDVDVQQTDVHYRFALSMFDHNP